METTYETIFLEKDKGVATIRLNRPSAFNAFNATMIKEITKALKIAGKDKAIRCIMITGEGKGFSGGQDLAEVEADVDYAALLRARYHPMLRALREAPKPVVAAVNGTAAGAGMSLALACDFRLVQPQVKFVSAFLDIGLIPDCGFLYMLPSQIGYARAMETIVLGKPITGEEAGDMGLATKVIAPENWETEVAAFSQRLAALPTKAFSLVKRYMLDGMQMPLDELLEKEAQAQQIAGTTEDHQEGITAFKEKRKPDFSGK